MERCQHCNCLRHDHALTWDGAQLGYGRCTTCTRCNGFVWPQQPRSAAGRVVLVANRLAM
jgi:hypothetical protein